MAHVTLRTIRSSDKPSFARWWRDDDLLALTSGDPNKISDAEVERYFSAMINAKDDYHFMIECDGTAIGHISLNQQKNGWYETQIVIGEKESWNKGYGPTAIKQLLQFAAQKRINKIYLEVRPDNQRAIAAYKKCDFKEVKTIHRAKEPYLKDVVRMEYIRLVIFSHNQKDEIKYLKILESERSWFVEKDFPAVLPPEGSDFAKLYRQHRTKIINRLPALEKSWITIETSVFTALQQKFGTLPSIVYHCHLSYFGPEGKYRRPNWIFVRTNPNKDANANRILETIAHELIHILIAIDAKNKQLPHEERERLVDSVFDLPSLKKIFPNYQKQEL